MSEDVVIRASGLSKKYILGHQAERERYTALRDVLAAKARGIFQGGGRGASSKEEFWALRDLDFEIRRGEVVGVIGRNGAGKSTLLKVLSRITEPTNGRVEIRGRVASLLEVGTGFHPELTGRENIFLNGAILGMSRTEIRRKFDEIVSFAEVEKFLDTPVKRYSSGMYVRLAFSVAAHLEPEILVVDEVLAVGDAEFQKKCLGKMQDVAGHGRTVLFVSHNIPTVQALCDTGIFLRNGRLTQRGPISSVCEAYRAQSELTRPFDQIEAVTRRESTRNLRFGSLSIVTADGQAIARPHTGQDISFVIDLTGSRAKPRPGRLELHVFSMTGAPLMICATEASFEGQMIVAAGDRFTCRIPRLPLVAGRYKLGLFMEAGGVIEEWIEDGLILDVEDSSYFGSGSNMPATWRGVAPITDHVWSRRAGED